MNDLPGYSLAIQGAYDARFRAHDPARVVAEARAMHEVLSRFDAPGPLARVVDVGCGLGHLAIHLALAHPEADVVGVDFSPVAVDVAARAAALAGAANARFALADASGLPVEAGAVSLLTASAVFNLIPEKQDALRAWARALARGGIVKIGDGFLATQGRVPDGPGPMNLATLELMASGAGLRVAGSEDATALVRRLHAEGLWQWTEYVRTGEALRFLAVTLAHRESGRP